MSRSKLRSGDLLPRIRVAPPGPRAQAASRRLAAIEAPGINTLYEGRPNLLWQEARGANVLDVDDNRYIDLTAGFGVAAIGHRHPRVISAIRRQSGRLLHGLGDAAGHPLRIALAERLVARTPFDNGQVYFAVSGADAIEIAVKTALLATDRPTILAFDPSYHGLTLGALAASSRPAFRRPFAAHLHRHVHRLPFDCPIDQLHEAFDRREPIGAVVVEPIVGREGVLVPKPGWLHALRELSDQHGACLIADEIFTGFGRTGSWFAVDHESVRPDLLCCGKALGGGLPIGAVVGDAATMAAWTAPGEARHTATFVANPLSCAAALAVLDVLDDDTLIARARILGSALGKRLAGWPARFAAVGSVRGRGMVWGIVLRSAEAARRFTETARQRGILLLAGGPDGTVAQIVPPLVITEKQLDTAIERLEEGLESLP